MFDLSISSLPLTLLCLFRLKRAYLRIMNFMEQTHTDHVTFDPIMSAFCTLNDVDVAVV